MNDNFLKLLAKKYGTPAYIYDSTQIISNIEKIRKGIGTKPKLYYSVKANPNQHLLKLIGKYVDGMEVCSVGEFKIAQQAGIDADKMIFVGPGKREDELRFVLSQGIGRIIVESVQELEFLNSIADKQKIKIALRINPKMAVAGERLNMAGASTQFGMDEKSVFSILQKNKYNNLSIDGIHFYFGTQQLNGQVLNEQFMCAIDIIKKIIALTPLKFIDFGGGFGVPYYENEVPFDFKLLKEWKAIIHSSIFEQYDVIIESGRYIIANSGYFLTKVLYTKEINERKFAIVDGGMNNHFSLACIGRLLKRDVPIEVLNDSNYSEKISVVGPLCTPVDIIGSNVTLPTINPQDIIKLKNAGAYGYTYSPQLFLSHPAPIELLVDADKNVHVIREVAVVN